MLNLCPIFTNVQIQIQSALSDVVAYQLCKQVHLVGLCILIKLASVAEKKVVNLYGSLLFFALDFGCNKVSKRKASQF